MRTALRAVTGLAAGTLAAAYSPALTSIGPVRQALSPRVLPARLSGLAPDAHVALTFDDGPDHSSTPAFLDLLERHDRRATFFLLGEHVATHGGLVEEMAAAGHELAVHGWDHRCTAWKRPGVLAEELRRARGVVEETTGETVEWYRPPYGVLTTGTLLAARTAGLQTVLWSAWGHDWAATATGERIARTVRRQLRAGGTVLLHDTDRASAPGSWWRTLAATGTLLDEWDAAEVEVGPLAEHWTDPRPHRPRGEQPTA